MRVYVKVPDAETYPVHTVRTRDELRRIFDFARIGSQKGQTRLVYKVPPVGRHRLIAKYVDGQSRSTKAMRARRSPLWDLAAVAAVAGIKKIITG